ncbi:hypothetical protein NQ318_020100 [Aromia moschata]|uniref:Uncharacterized protein n=1 Tax=Aromia moschata TaxID=1265417 RepID=A0AAV8ZBT1_9CUCU|nr:hypothetical protein NQ318_020100 [Aromia moschata]
MVYVYLCVRRLGKSFPFEFDVRVPFLVRGPGVEPGTVVNDIVLNIDLAPTFLDMAGVEPPTHMDGRSVLPLFLNPKRKKLRWPDTFLIESSGRRETPHLDAKLSRLAKYTVAANLPNSTAKIPYSSTTPFSQPSYQTTALPAAGYPTAAPPVARIYDSGEDLPLDTVDSDAEDDLDEEEDAEEEEDDDDIDIEEKTNIDNLGLAATNKGLVNGEGDMQLDNRLLPVPPLPSKLERLAIECLQDEMKLPCRPRQKWYCENDAGRWRKHKCKSAVQSIPLPSERAYRKCACFTPNGLVYKKLPVSICQCSFGQTLTTCSTMREMSLVSFLVNALGDTAIVVREKQDLADTRETPNWTRYCSKGWGEEKIHRLSKREKRDTLTHVENAMDDVRDQIQGLKVENDTMPEDADAKANLETNTISDDTLGCVIERGKVNCSTVIYQDKKTWRRSRHRIENEIQELKQKLETLKEIRRHLKHSRPLEEESLNGTSLSEFNELNFNQMFPASNAVSNESAPGKMHKKKRKRPHDYEDGKKPKIDEVAVANATEVETTAVPGESAVAMEVTTAVPTVFTNPHRHGHHKQHAVTEHPLNASNSTPSPVASRHKKVEAQKVSDEREAAREEKRRLREERLRRKLRKQRKKDQLEKECSHERMNCFHHDNDHWKTAPQWTAGPFCFCMNANNNTYSCVRTINATHNFLYCEFTTGFVTYYNLRIDPFELQNRVDTLKPEERSYLHNLLKHLIACKGKSCTVGHHGAQHVMPRTRGNVLPLHTMPQQRFKKRKFLDDAARTLPLIQEYPYRSDYSQAIREHPEFSRTRRINGCLFQALAKTKDVAVPAHSVRVDTTERDRNSSTIARGASRRAVGTEWGRVVLSASNDGGNNSLLINATLAGNCKTGEGGAPARVVPRLGRVSLKKNLGEQFPSPRCYG